MLTVWCVLNGTKYTDNDAHILRGMVARNLSTPHQFRCLSDRQIPGVDCLVPAEVWPGWWAKLMLFRYATTGLHLYLDLDTVVVGNLSALLSEQFSLPANWGQSGHGGCQSSVMAWGKDYSFISNAFDPGELRPDAGHPFGRYGDTDWWGDQGFLTWLLGNPGDGVIIPMQGVYSYRYHCRGVLPDDCRVVCFHGEPKPKDVTDPWVIRSRSIPTSA